MKLYFSKLTILTFVFLISFFTVSAQTDREKGIALFEQGKSKEAVKSLKKFLKNNQKDAEAWNILGQAYLKINDIKNSIKSFQRAIDEDSNNSDFRVNLAYIYLSVNKINDAQNEIEASLRLNPSNANAYYLRAKSNMYERKYDDTISDADRVIEIDKTFSAAFVLKSDALIYKFGENWRDRKAKENMDLLASALAILESCVDECRINDKSNEIAKQRENIKAFYNHFQKENEVKDQILPIDNSRKTEIKFIYKSFPSYTDVARNSNISGTVNLAVLFGSDAKVKFIVVTKSLGYGLDEQAIKAANKIQFEPATRDGKAVSVLLIVQYTFTIY